MLDTIKKYYKEPLINFIVKMIVVYGIWKVLLKASQVVIPFKAKWEIMMDAILNFVNWMSFYLLKLMGYNIIWRGAYLNIAGKEGVWVGPACIGVGVMVTYIGLILAYKGSAKLRIGFIVLGLFLINFINALRVAVLCIISATHNEWVEFNHKYVFNNLLYLCVLLIWIWYVNLSVKETKLQNISNENP